MERSCAVADASRAERIAVEMKAETYSRRGVWDSLGAIPGPIGGIHSVGRRP
jgi:hypothetical protein